MKHLFQLVRLCLPSILLSASLATYAAEHEHHEQRQHGAHEHGTTLLNMAVEDSQLHIEIESPAMNIVGFEHAPKNHEQEHAIAHATAALKDASTLFIMSPAARCALSEAHVNSPLLAEEQHGHYEHAGKEHADEHKDTHSEFHASYIFLCKNITALKEVDLQIFKTFSRTDEIRAQIITGKGQMATELTPASHKLVITH